MHRMRAIGRPVALLAVTAVVLAVVAWFSGSVTQQEQAFADGNFERPYLSCTNSYLDLPPLTDKGSAPGAEDTIPTGASLSRGEPSLSEPGAMDLTVVTYLGPNLDGDAIGIPDAPPAELCSVLTTAAKSGPENGRLHTQLNYSVMSDIRPTVTANFVTKGADTNLEYVTCVYGESTGQWLRTDVSIVEANKGANSTNYGIGTLYPDAASPTIPGDPATCDVTGAAPYVDAFPFVTVSTTRTAATDHPELTQNAAYITAGDLEVDPDGPSPKVKGVPQAIDGDTLADDWDGDGCPDWDELDHGAELLEANGLDPFNPHDCNQSVDASGIYRFSATALTSTKEAPGAYFHCIGDMQQDGNDLEMRMYCYTDSTALAVNPEAGPEVGDGYQNSPPPAEAIPQEGGAAESGAECQNGIDEDADTVVDDGCPAVFGDVDDIQSVLTGTLDKGTNEIILSGCYEDRDGAASVGNVWIVSTQDAHTGRGTADLYLLQPDGCAGSPVGDPTFAAAPISSVKVAEKGLCAKDEPQCSGGGQIDFDGDNCPDKNELTDNQQEGGLRDPYNRWDYMNPTGDGQNRVDDILATVNQYFIDAGNPSYTTHTDRTSLVGANAWNLGPPNGQQRVDDILASVKSYFHDCSGGSYDDPDDEL